MTSNKASVCCIATFCMVLVFLCGPPLANAKRAPSVCDGLKGKAYGLCNAYCESLDCDWCGDINEDDAVSTQREIDFTRAIIKWTMDNHCVDPGQIFATGFSNGALWSHTLARHPDTSGLFKAVVPVDGVDQAGVNDHLKWIHAPQDGDSPWILHVNEVYDDFEPYDGRPYTDYGPPEWIYPPVLQIFAEYALENEGYSECGFGPDDVGDRNGVFEVGGVVPSGYSKLDGLRLRRWSAGIFSV